MSNVPSFTVGDWAVTPSLNLLERAGDSMKLEPRSMDLLVCLARRAPEVVSADDLIEEVWRGRVVTDGSIYQRVNQLRNAFGDSIPELIETIPKRGYRLVAPVEFFPENGSARKWPEFLGLTPRRGLAAAAALAVVIIAATALLVSPWSLLRTAAESEAQTIAVLPFENLSGNEDDDYLGEGIAEEVIHALANGAGLRVVARTSSFQFQNTSAGIPEIGERLGAAVILEGSVRTESGRLRVMAHLVETDSGYHIWSETFDRSVDELIIVEREIALAVAERLMGDEADLGRIAAALPPVGNIEAYEYYLLGRERMQIPSGLSREWPIADADQAVEYFRRAIALDPNFARAYTGLADALLRRAVIGRGFSQPGEVPTAVAEEALAAVDRAEVLAPQLAEARYSRGLVVRILEQDEDRAFDLFREAIALDPNLVSAYFTLGISVQGEEGVAALNNAVQLDPMSSQIHRWLSIILSSLGKIEEAALHHERFVSLEPDSYDAFVRRAVDKSIIGRPDEAIRVLEPLLGDPDFKHQQLRIRALIVRFYLALNDDQSAQELLSSIEERSDATADWLSVALADNARIQLALVQGRHEDVADLVHTRGPLSERPVMGLYEMMIDHDEHARDFFEKLNSQQGLASIGINVDWGYHPAVNAAHLYLRAGNETKAAATLESVRRALNPAFEDRYTAGGAYYLLASIHAIEGDSEQALAALDEAVAHGWTKHWYAVLDPNLESLRDEPRFQAFITDLRREMGRLRLEMEPFVALE